MCVCALAMAINSITLKYLPLYKISISKKTGGFYLRPSLNPDISFKCIMMLSGTCTDFKPKLMVFSLAF